MKTLLIMTIVQLFCTFSSAYIPPVEMVFAKSVAQNSKQTILFEQDVYFSDGLREAVVKEAWLMDGDKKLKMVAQGQGEYKDRIKIVAIYKDGQRTTMVGKNKISEAYGRDFFERYLGFRTTNDLNKLLTDFNIPIQMRLSRSAGALSFAIGVPSADKQNTNPQLWIKQDSFEFAKLRSPSRAEFTFDEYATINSNWSYPKIKKIEWNGKTVQIKVRNVSLRPNTSENTFIPQMLENPSELFFSEHNNLTLTIEEFYKRFR